MKKITVRSRGVRLARVLAAGLLAVGGGCGGSGGGSGGDAAPDPSYTFLWIGTVTSITPDGMSGPPPGVAVGDQMVATMVYDPATFGVGVDVTSDGLDYSAPGALEMVLTFTSGGVATREVDGVRVRDGGAFDQWNWTGPPNGLVFQANDASDGSFTLPLPGVFADVHAIFLASLGAFNAGSSVRIPAADPQESVRLDLEADGFTILKN